MSKKMLVNATHPEENRVAIVEDGILTELDIEVAGKEPTKGNIYKAVVVRVETGLQAAFVDYGAERLGFLQIDEINFSLVKPDHKSEDGRRPRINELLHRGQELLVQITKEERGTKGAALTTYLSLAGRYMVLMPGSQTRGVSRRAESDAQRKELKKAMSSIEMAEGIGYIVRTAALDQTREELERDYRYLIRLFESIKELNGKAKAPALIYKESNLMIRSIRDYFTTDMDEVLIDDPQVFKEAREFFQLVMPDHVRLVKQHQERRPIFSRYQIEDQIETLSRNKVSLPSGGSIVIDPTEALVAIDVNSGKMASEQGVEATATKTNLEAAAEVGRQLRLRDLGGLIVVDFIDMRESKHMRQVENQLKKSLENDKARVSVGRISKFGLLEMSRQRIKAALTQGSHLPCPHCNGTGHLKSPEAQAVALLRKIHASAAKGQVARVEAQLPMDVASHLLNFNREELVEMERRYQLQIHIHGNRDFLADQVEIEIQKKEKEKQVQSEYVAAGSVPMTMAEEPVGESAPQEKVKDEAVEDNAAQVARQDGQEPAAEPGKKRRRRRRRKSAAAVPSEGQETPAVAEETPPGQSAAPAEGAAEMQSEETSPAPATELTETEPAAKKPRRRKRSSAKGKTAEGEAEAKQDVVETSGDETGSTSPPVQPGEGEGMDAAAAAKPKSRRSRRKAKPEAEQVQDATVDTAGGQVSAETMPAAEATPAGSAPAEPLPKAESAEKPKRTRARRSAKQADPVAEPVSEQAKQVDTAPDAGGEDAEPAAAKKTSRRAARKATSTEKDEKAPAEKPAAKRTTKKSPAPKSAKASAGKESKPAADRPDEGEAPTKAKPKRPRATRKKADDGTVEKQ